MNIMDLISSKLSGPNLTNISRQIGSNEHSTKNALMAAVPMMLAALAKNAASKNGAQAINQAVEEDHPAARLDNVATFLGNPSSVNGQGILSHLFGGRKARVEETIAKSSGLDSKKVMSLMAIAAPLVMSAINKAKREENLGAQQLPAFLLNQKEKSKEQSGGMFGKLMDMLDKDDDGSVMDDLGAFAGNFGGRNN